MIADWLLDPLSDPAFERALIDVAVVAVVSGVVGTFIVLRGTAFLGDALAHAIFPGVVIAFLSNSSLIVGALVAALIAAALIGGLTANTRVPVDTAIGVIFTAAFALGVVVLTGEHIGEEELEGILFGEPLNATWADVIVTAGIGGVVAGALLAMRRIFVIASFDPSGARAMGLPVIGVDIVLLLLTALTVVISFKAVGNILVIALLVTPAATARLLTDRLLSMAALASVVALSAGVVGLYVGYHAESSAGGAIVLVSAGGFFAAWLAAPRHGMLTTMVARRSAAYAVPEAEAEVMLSSPAIRAPHEPG